MGKDWNEFIREQQSKQAKNRKGKPEVPDKLKMVPVVPDISVESPAIPLELSEWSVKEWLKIVHGYVYGVSERNMQHFGDLEFRMARLEGKFEEQNRLLQRIHDFLSRVPGYEEVLTEEVPSGPEPDYQKKGKVEKVG